jgi:hypothetical protein
VVFRCAETREPGRASRSGIALTYGKNSALSIATLQISSVFASKICANSLTESLQDSNILL